MNNRIVPTGIRLQFCAKAKTTPGEISRVKKSDIMSENPPEKTPKIDTFTSSHQVDEKTGLVEEQVPGKAKNLIFQIFTK